MLANPPYRQFLAKPRQVRDWNDLFLRSARVAAVFATLSAATHQCRGETGSTIAAHPAIGSTQTSFHAPTPRENAIQIVAVEKSTGTSNPVAAKQASTHNVQPTAKPPITTSDYENVSRHSIPSAEEVPPVVFAPHAQEALHVPGRTFPKRLEPVTPVESSSESSRQTDEPAPRVIDFGKPSSAVTSRSAETQHESPAKVDADTNWLLALAPTPRVAMQQQTPVETQPVPTPVDPKVESQPARTETLPNIDESGRSLPMTSSNYLPADPESYCFRCGVKCPPCGCNPGGPGWAAARPIPWEVFAQGEYVGPARLAHVPVYRLRVDDRLAFVYRLSGQVSGQPYRLNVRDRVLVQSLSAPEVINREVIVEPDGTITLPLLGQVRASGATLGELSRQLDEQFKRQIKDPRITVTPIIMNSNLEELRSSVDRRYGQGGQVSDGRVSPDGTIQLPAIGSVPAQGLTLDELEREIKSRYALLVNGLEVTPILTERAPRFVYVVGEVRLPGRFTMEGPTTVMQAIALAGSWNVGAQLNEVVVFRRDENWQLMATKVNVRSSLLFKKPCPEGEIWLRDSDIVLVPKSPILCADDVIELVFTRGIYGVFPMSASLNFTKLTSL